PGMNSIGPGLPRCVDDLSGGEVAFRCGCGAYRDRAIRSVDVRCCPVDIGIHRYALDVHFTAGPNDAEGDFAAIRDHEATDHEKAPPQNALRCIRQTEVTAS